MYLKRNSTKLSWRTHIATTLFILVFNNSLINCDLIDTNNFTTILLWTSPLKEPFVFMDEGQETFIKRKCPVQNCYVTLKRDNNMMYTSIQFYDIIVFNGPELALLDDFPKERSPYQRYVFVSNASADSYSLCDEKFNSFFNLSWTYKFNSEISLGNIIVRDKNGEIIGPKEMMHWLDIKQMENVTPEIRDKLKGKSKFAAIIASDCKDIKAIDEILTSLQKELDKFDLKIDVYGDCGVLKCPPEGKMEDCLQIIERDYLFYLSFESSFSEDYVTDKLLHALQNYAVPVVHGGANYTEFMPDGIYLNAEELGPKLLAETMYNYTKDEEKYYNFFKWHNHYSYHKRSESPETDIYCNLCHMLHAGEIFTRNIVYHGFISWWNGHKCYKNSSNLFKSKIIRVREERKRRLIETESKKVLRNQNPILPFLDVLYLY